MQKFRLSPNTIDTLILRIGDQLKHDTDRNYALSPNQQLLLGIRYLATGGHMRLVGDANGVSKATMSRVVHRVVESINLTLFDE
uniref:Uncharacterized protein n=1 Tax=Romanomermis culicivorax TaxID=13658 RepID=A0A915K9Z9_ROMCU